MDKQKATSLREKKTLSVKNNEHAEHTITHQCGAMEHKNIIAEIDYRFLKYTA